MKNATTLNGARHVRHKCLHPGHQNESDGTAKRFQGEVDELAISTVVLRELLHGAEKSDWPVDHLEMVENLVTRLAVLDFDPAAATHSANIKAVLERDEQIIGPNNPLIAGHARSIGAKLITGNLGKFRRADGLRCEDWLGEETP